MSKHKISVMAASGMAYMADYIYMADYGRYMGLCNDVMHALRLTMHALYDHASVKKVSSSSSSFILKTSISSMLS